jgi:hypothetical protein
MGNAPRLDGIIERLESARALGDLQGIIVALRDQLGVDHVVYHWVASSPDTSNDGVLEHFEK